VVSLAAAVVRIFADCMVAQQQLQRSCQLLIAARKRNWRRVRELCEAGGPVDAKLGTGSTALHLAAQHGAVDASSALLAARADVNARDLSRVSVLGAASRGTTDPSSAPVVVRNLLEQRAVVDAPDQRGQTPLMMASSCGSLQVVHVLLEYKADVNARCCRAIRDRQRTSHRAHQFLGDGSTSAAQRWFDASRAAELEAAAEEAVELEVSEDEESERDPWESISQDGTESLAMSLYEVTPLRKIDMKKKSLEEELVRRQMKFRGIEFPGSNDDLGGDSALNLAARSGHSEVCVELLAHGADPHLRGKYCEEALSVGARSGHVEVCRVLAEVANADLRRKALALAEQHGHLSVAALLHGLLVTDNG